MKTTEGKSLPPVHTGYSWQAAVEMLRSKDIVIRQLPGDYCVNFRQGTAATEYRTDDLDDAVAYDLAMSSAPAVDPPLGPLGSRQTARSKMYRHNRKLAARRRQRDKS